MQKTLCALALLLVLLIFFGCTTKVENSTMPLSSDLNSSLSPVPNSNSSLELNSLYSIAQADKDFNDFKQIEPTFVPTSVDCNNFSPTDFVLIKEDWNQSNSALATLIPFIEEKNLTEETIFCVFTGLKTNKYKLIAIIDQAKGSSVMIAAFLKLETGFGA